MRPAAAVLLLTTGCATAVDKETAEPADTADTAAPVDADGDGFSEDEDCDDGDAAISPAAQEVCDGVDNDCDTLVDDSDPSVDTEGALVVYPDADGDGYGDQAAGEGACELFEPMLLDGSDCDDTRDDINPDGLELCDGVNNDCDVTTSESGMASWQAEGGALEDWTAALQPAGADPLPLSLEAPGTLYLCEGEWPLLLSITSSVDIVAPGGPEKTALTGRGAGRPVTVRGAAATLTGLTVQGGVGTGSLLGETYGGGIACEQGGALGLEGVIVRENQAGVGGGILSQGCVLSASDTTLQANTAGAAGGGLALVGGNANLNDCAVDENAVTDDAGLGGGMLVRSEADGAPASVLLQDTAFSNNSGALGSGLYLHSGEATCSGTPGLKNGGFYEHSGGTAAVHVDGGMFTSVSCDFGLPDSPEDNTPSDVLVGEAAFDFEDDQTFSCAPGDGCR